MLRSQTALGNLIKQLAKRKNFVCLRRFIKFRRIMQLCVAAVWFEGWEDAPAPALLPLHPRLKQTRQARACGAARHGARGAPHASLRPASGGLCAHGSKAVLQPQ